MPVVENSGPVLSGGFPVFSGLGSFVVSVEAATRAEHFSSESLGVVALAFSTLEYGFAERALDGDSWSGGASVVAANAGAEYFKMAPVGLEPRMMRSSSDDGGSTGRAGNFDLISSFGVVGGSHVGQYL
jgi:hypothetical protein